MPRIDAENASCSGPSATGAYLGKLKAMISSELHSCVHHCGAACRSSCRAGAACSYSCRAFQWSSRWDGGKSMTCGSRARGVFGARVRRPRTRVDALARAIGARGTGTCSRGFNFLSTSQQYGQQLTVASAARVSARERRALRGLPCVSPRPVPGVACSPQDSASARSRCSRR